MKKYTLVCLTLVLSIFFASCDRKKQSVLNKEEIQFIKGQFENTLAVANDPFKIPRTTTENGVLKTVDIFDWTSGFFAGNLWYMYEITGEDKWKSEAIKFTEALDSVQYFSNHHDVGIRLIAATGMASGLQGIRSMKKLWYRLQNR